MRPHLEARVTVEQVDDIQPTVDTQNEICECCHAHLTDCICDEWMERMDDLTPEEYFEWVQGDY